MVKPNRVHANRKTGIKNMLVEQLGLTTTLNNTFPQEEAQEILVERKLILLHEK